MQYGDINVDLLGLYPHLCVYLSDCFLLQVRAIISDFAVFITIATMVGIDFALGVPSPKLQVPNEFKVSRLVMHFTMMNVTAVLSAELCLT